MAACSAALSGADGVPNGEGVSATAAVARLVVIANASREKRIKKLRKNDEKD
jgi:hypothetical protein